MRYVHGEDVKENGSDQELQTFKAETESLLALLPRASNSFKDEFRFLHDYGVNNETPTGCLLVSRRTKCRSCNRKLSTDQKTHTIVVYHAFLGTFLGLRGTKFCKSCKISENYGYWSKEGKKHFEDDALENEYLLSTEDTAFDIVVGATPFSTFAEAFNRRFNTYKKENEKEGIPPSMKRRKTKCDIQSRYDERRTLDRRRLEEGFLLFAVLKVVRKYSVPVNEYHCDRNALVGSLNENFHSSFIKKWGDHICDTAGCNSVIVIDGNMKNARQVCSCKNVSELNFDGLNGSIAIGCLNTPCKGERLCSEHVDNAIKFTDDTAEMEEDTSKKIAVNDKEDEVLPIKVMNEKETRNGKFYEILWSDNRQSWMKLCNLPAKIKKMIEEGRKYEILQDRKEIFGQGRKVLKNGGKGIGSRASGFSNSGFGIERREDNVVIQEDGSTLNLKCGTEKGKHKCKNSKTAGILVFEKPCGIAVNVMELYGSESKSQVYGHLHSLMSKAVMENTEVVCYDDACHLKKFAINPLRASQSETAIKICKMDIVCDRFHFKNHTDKWCKQNCNPHKCEKLKEVNTELCEQLFSWLSRFSHITKHMNRERFLFLMLYVLDSHNTYTSERL